MVVQFVVNEDGSISDSRVVRSIDPQLDAEALRVVNAMPAWEPGIQNGKAVKVKYNVPVAFGVGPRQSATSAKADVEVRPLIVVDGKEVADMNGLKPENFKSIKVLKGDEAVKLYGEKGRNGVFLIATK